MQLKTVQQFYGCQSGNVLLTGNNFVGYTVVKNFPKNWKKPPIVIKTKKLVEAVSKYENFVKGLKENKFNLPDTKKKGVRV